MVQVLLLLLVGVLSVVLLVLGGRRRKVNEPPLIKGWTPYLGKAWLFGKDAYKFLAEHQKKFGDVFTVLIAGKYMTFVMDPLFYPSIVKHRRQLDFHEFSNRVAPFTFGYPPINEHDFPDMKEKIQRSFKLLQGDGLVSLTKSMMGNLMMVFRQDHMTHNNWRRGSLYHFCMSIMFEASFLTMFGRPRSGRRHNGMKKLREDFIKFDKRFPLLIAQIPIWLLWGVRAARKRIIDFLLPERMVNWSDKSEFIRARIGVFDGYPKLKGADKAAHHFAILWASVGNTAPATFWATYYLVSHQEALQAVRREIHEVLRASGVEFSSDTDVMLSKEQLDKLVYLDSVVNESLRLSSASMNIRVAQENFGLRLDENRTVAVRKGDIIAMYPQIMHLDPGFYENPRTFRFDRYMSTSNNNGDALKDSQRMKSNLMPFGSGSSMCPGRFFAVNEIKQFLCLLLLYFDVELEDGQNRVETDPGRAGLGILMPDTDVQFRYAMRAV